MKRGRINLGKAGSPIYYHADISYRDWFRNNIIDSNTVLIGMWQHPIDTKTYITASQNMFSCCYACDACSTCTIQLV